MNTLRPLLLVAGLGRCGSSLCMQMLHAGGVPCAGEPPAFEPGEANALSVTVPWLADQRGTAVKLLDPQRAPALGRLPAIAIFLTRDPGQQAASMAKFNHLLSDLPIASRHQRRALEAGIRRDTRLARAALQSFPVLELTFEQLILSPYTTADEMWLFLSEHGFRFDAAAAAKVVRARSPQNYPGLLELELLRTAGAV